jgi:hypothetical protein
MIIHRHHQISLAETGDLGGTAVEDLRDQQAATEHYRELGANT